METKVTLLDFAITLQTMLAVNVTSVNREVTNEVSKRCTCISTNDEQHRTVLENVDHYAVIFRVQSHRITQSTAEP